MSDIPDDIKLTRARASIFEAAVHKYFPRYVDVCTINDALDAYAAEHQRHAEIMEEVLKVLGPLGKIAAAVFYVDEDGREMNSSKSDDRAVWGFDKAELTYGDLRGVRALLSRLEER